VGGHLLLVWVFYLGLITTFLKRLTTNAKQIAVTIIAMHVMPTKFLNKHITMAIVLTTAKTAKIAAKMMLFSAGLKTSLSLSFDSSDD
jgi:hypothetical protein